MVKVLLGSIIGAVPTQVVKAIRLLLDFIYLSQYLVIVTKHYNTLIKHFRPFIMKSKYFKIWH